MEPLRETVRGAEIDHLDEVWSRYKNLKVQDLEEQAALPRAA
ncbi:hypothetical protein SBADM41S_11938 [Streptomyces badius]